MNTTKVTIRSFGHLHGMPATTGLYLDMSTLRNPHHDPAMRYATGLDPTVAEHVLDTPGALELLDAAERRVGALMRGTPDLPLTVLVGCQGGRHRSVAIAEALATRLRAQRFVTVDVVHHHIDRPVVEGVASRGRR